MYKTYSTQQVFEYNEFMNKWVDAVVKVKTKTVFCDVTFVNDDHYKYNNGATVAVNREKKADIL